MEKKQNSSQTQEDIWKCEYVQHRPKIYYAHVSDKTTSLLVYNKMHLLLNYNSTSLIQIKC